MTTDDALILTINGGSSSIKFALFEAGDALERIAAGAIDRIGLPRATLEVKGRKPADNCSRLIAAPDYASAIDVLTSWLEESGVMDSLGAVGHRVVHGGSDYLEPQRVTAEMLETLRRLGPFDPDHLPQEIQLIESFRRHDPQLAQVACFDTAFHRDMPRVSQMLPIPRRYAAQHVRRYGFHGLSYAYLMEELARVAGDETARGRVILAHLGNGASMAAVRDGKSIDTSMGFTPAAGLVMSTRTGDLDPGVAWHLLQNAKLTPRQFNHLVNHESGLLGVSETSSDMRDLIAREASDVRAAEAIELFCYQARKWIGAYAAALGGLDTLVFAGGIGENLPVIRARICDGLGFLGIEIDDPRNGENAAVISRSSGQISVRVMHTDEEVMIAKSTCRLLGFDNAGLAAGRDWKRKE